MKMTQKITRDAILSLNSHSVYGSGLNCCSLHGKQKGQANNLLLYKEKEKCGVN